jgi:hypothetical protein
MPHRSLSLALAVLAVAPAFAQGATYRVYPPPVESPIHTAPPPPADARRLLTDPFDSAASPYGWHDTDGAPGAEHTTTQGNNATVYLDRNADGTPHPGDFADGGPGLDFDFPLDLTQSPSAYGDAVLADLFYWTNLAHDTFHRHGFDEAAGNFQVHNYGHGGLGGDPVRAEAQDGSGTNGGNFFTPPDGQPPRMQAFVWTITMPPRDGALDHVVVLHELAHGVSNRLTGGPDNVICLSNAEQGGEGWSDWYGLMLTMRPGDDGAEGRGVGTYLLGQPPDGPGFRPAPFSTDFAVNAYTYGDTRTAVVPHGVGFIWATVLWEVAWELIDGLGYAPSAGIVDRGIGYAVALDLVTEGLKFQPCSPGFVDARDGILAADLALYGGTHHDLLWAAFARRGLGFSAAQGSSNSNADNTEAFDLPPQAATRTPDLVPVALTFDAVGPNPTRGALRVSFALRDGGAIRLGVFDVLGRAVAAVEEFRTPDRHEMQLDVSGLAPGTYVLQLANGEAVRTHRFTIVH